MGKNWVFTWNGHNLHQERKAMGFFLIKPQRGQGPTFPDLGLTVKVIGPSCPDRSGLWSTWSCTQLYALHNLQVMICECSCWLLTFGHRKKWEQSCCVHFPRDVPRRWCLNLLGAIRLVFTHQTESCDFIYTIASCLCICLYGLFHPHNSISYFSISLFIKSLLMLMNVSLLKTTW